MHPFTVSLEKTQQACSFLRGVEQQTQTSGLQVSEFRNAKIGWKYIRIKLITTVPPHPSPSFSVCTSLFVMMLASSFSCIMFSVYSWALLGLQLSLKYNKEQDLQLHLLELIFLLQIYKSFYVAILTRIIQSGNLEALVRLIATQLKDFCYQQFNVQKIS